MGQLPIGTTDWQDSEHELISAIVAAGERSVKGLVAAYIELFSDQKLKPGERLPPIRKIASEIAMSPTSVGLAWRYLSELDYIVGQGRSGTFVSSGPRLTTRQEQPRWNPVPKHSNSMADLSLGFPDKHLLPRLSPSNFERIFDLSATGYHEDPVLGELTEKLYELFPFSKEHSDVTVVDGSLDAIDRLLKEVASPGDVVAVENPNFPAIFDIVEANSLVPAPLAMDSHGITPDSLEKAILSGAKIMITQPRSQNPTGCSRGTQRTRKLAEVIAATRRSFSIIEDDHSALISSSKFDSFAQFLPEITSHIVSFSKSHGPDLRIAGIFAPNQLIEKIESRRRLGPAWTSKTLQHILVNLLSDPKAEANIQDARSTYRRRRLLLEKETVDIQGIRTPTDGLNLWIPVDDETQALISLASKGIVAAPGSHFWLDGPRYPAIRLTLAFADRDELALAEDISSSIAQKPGSFRM